MSAYFGTFLVTKRWKLLVYRLQLISSHAKINLSISFTILTAVCDRVTLLCFWLILLRIFVLFLIMLFVRCWRLFFFWFFGLFQKKSTNPWWKAFRKILWERGLRLRKSRWEGGGGVWTWHYILALEVTFIDVSIALINKCWKTALHFQILVFFKTTDLTSYIYFKFPPYVRLRYFCSCRSNMR